MEISGRAFAVWYYVEPWGLWWTNVLHSALPPQRHRPDSWLEHQDPVSYSTGIYSFSGFFERYRDLWRYKRRIERTRKVYPAMTTKSNKAKRGVIFSPSSPFTRPILLVLKPLLLGRWETGILRVVEKSGNFGILDFKKFPGPGGWPRKWRSGLPYYFFIEGKDLVCSKTVRNARSGTIWCFRAFIEYLSLIKIINRNLHTGFFYWVKVNIKSYFFTF